MNKKRVALALAAALGINTLMVTVGQVGEQAVIAHAVDSRLTNPEHIDILNSMKINTLETQVNMVSSTDATLTFPKIVGEIKNLIVKDGFKHKVFTERSEIDSVLSTGINATWNNDSDELKVTGMNAPGIYTGVVEVEFADGSKETYTISLRKTPSDSISFTTEVTAGMVKIKDLKLNNGVEDKNVFTADDVTLTNKRTGMTAKVNLQDEKPGLGFSALDLAEGGKLQEGDVLELKVNYGAGVSGNRAYTLTSGIVLVKQATPKIEKAVVTNNSTFATTIAAQINTDFGVTDGKDTGSSLTANGKTILNYEQSTSTADGKTIYGGGDLGVSVSGLGVDLTLNSAGVSITNNYVGYATLDYGINSSGNDTFANGLIGDYTLSIGGQTITYFDAVGTRVPKKTSVTQPANHVNKNFIRYFDSNNTQSNLPKAISIDSQNNRINLNLESSLSHGYTSVAGAFEVDTQADKDQVSAISLEESGKTPINAKIKVENIDPVKVSLIVSADILDGTAVQTKFTKTSESEGKITLVGGASTLQDSTLSVTGATVGNGAVIGQDLVFSVQFNGDVPSNISWELTSKGNNKLAGTLDSGSIEAVNITTVKATNEGAESLAKQFLINADTDLTFPNDSKGKLTVDNLDSNRVTLEKFVEGPHTVNFVVNEGKYQGTYSAGIDVEYQEVSVILSPTNVATSNSITLAVKGLESVEGALDEVREAWLEYKLADDVNNVWVDDRRDKIDLNKLASELEFRVTKTGLKPSTFYDFRVAYQVVGDETIYYSNILEDEDTLAQGANNGSGTITGGGGTTSGTSTGSTTITVSTSNSTMNGNNIDVNLPSGFKYDSAKSLVVTGIKYKDKDGKIVTETKDQFKNVTAKFNGTKVELMELVTSKDYTEITVDYTDNNGKVRSIILKNVKLTSNVESDKYLANIYEVVFGRPADESGYHYHLKNLKNKSVSLRDFVLNMLSEKEFGEKYKTTESKIEALYSAIVNRTSDEAGKKFWVDEYKKVLAVYGSESNALRAIADRMVNEGELKTLAEKMNLKW